MYFVLQFNRIVNYGVIEMNPRDFENLVNADLIDEIELFRPVSLDGEILGDWQIDVRIKTGRTQQLQTARGGLKTFSNLDTAFNFVRNRGWKLNISLSGG
jgi:hypothetical protein